MTEWHRDANASSIQQLASTAKSGPINSHFLSSIGLKPDMSSKALEEVEAYCTEMLAVQKNPLFTKIGIAAPPQISFDLPIPLPWKGHLLFLNRILRQGMKIGSLRQDVQRLFGSSIL